MIIRKPKKKKKFPKGTKACISCLKKHASVKLPDGRCNRCRGV